MQNMNKNGKLQWRLKYRATVWIVPPVLKIKGWVAARESEETTWGSTATEILKQRPWMDSYIFNLIIIHSHINTTDKTPKYPLS